MTMVRLGTYDICEALTGEEQGAIEAALTRHGLEIMDSERDWFFTSIALHIYNREAEQEWKAGSTKAEITSQIESLRHALSELDITASRILYDCAEQTDAYRWAHEGGLISEDAAEYFSQHPDCVFEGVPLRETLPGKYAEANASIPSTFIDVALDMFEDACEIALAPETVHEESLKQIIESSAQKPGRPRNEWDVSFVGELMYSFETATGATAGETPEGPFDDFVRTVFLIAEPHRERKGSFRKLIRKAKHKD